MVFSLKSLLPDTPDRQDRWAAIGQIMGAQDRGEVADVSSFRDRIDARAKEEKLRVQLEDPDLLSQFSPQQRQMLAQMPPAAAQALIAETLFAKPTPVDTVEFNGNLVNKSTGEIVSQGTPQPGYKQLTPEEISSRGLDPTKAWQVNHENGKIEPIGGALVNVNTGDTGVDGGKFGELYAAELMSIVEAGRTSSGSLVQLDQLVEALDSSPAGFEAALVQGLAGMGIKLEGADNLERANAILSKLVPSQRPVGSGTMSDADLALFKASLPRLLNTRDGNAAITRDMRAIAEYNVQMGQIAKELGLGRITEDEATERFRTVYNPLEKYRTAPPSRGELSEAGIGGGAAPTAPAAPRVLTWNPVTGDFDKPGGN